MNKSNVTIHKQPQPRRKDSFWFDGHVATVEKGNVKVEVIATGHIEVMFSENDKGYENKDAVQIALDRGYTDTKLKKLNEHDGWGNNNWFGFEITINDKSYWHDDTSTNFDEAIEIAKSIVNEISAEQIENKKQPLVGLERYPEFKDAVERVSENTVLMLKNEARKITSDMPYKEQFLLEEIIRSLQERV